MESRSHQVSIARGDIVVADGDRMLVVSGGMYNSLLDEGGVIAIDVIEGPPSLLAVTLDDGWVALPGRISWIPKETISETVGRIDVQQLTDVNNMLFKILATD